MSKNEISKTITWLAHNNAWDIFLNGSKAMTDEGKLINS
jgi:hypothetical protein